MMRGHKELEMSKEEASKPSTARIDWVKSFKSPKIVRIDPEAVPGEAMIEGIEGPALVLLTLTAREMIEEGGRNVWIYDPEMYPKPDDVVELQKLLQRNDAFKILMKGITARVQPTVGSRAELLTYALGSAEVPYHCSIRLDWSAGLRIEKAAQEKRFEAYEQEQRLHQKSPLRLCWDEVLRKVDSFFGTKWADPLPTGWMEELIVIPEDDPWDSTHAQLVSKMAGEMVVDAMRSMYSVLFVRRPGAPEALKASGLAHAIHHTVLAGGPIEANGLARSSGKTLVAEPDIPVPASHVVQRPPPLTVPKGGLGNSIDVPMPPNVPRSGSRPRPLKSPNESGKS